MGDVAEPCTRRQLLRLPPIPLARLELAFLDAPPAMFAEAGRQVQEAAFGAAGQRSLLRDVHSCLLRLLEVTLIAGPSIGRVRFPLLSDVTGRQTRLREPCKPYLHTHGRLGALHMNFGHEGNPPVANRESVQLTCARSGVPAGQGGESAGGANTGRLRTSSIPGAQFRLQVTKHISLAQDC